MSSAAKPLAGVRVLELGALVAAPYCGMLLADLGAEVIKVEPPEGDMARHFAPFQNGESAFFMAVNRGKKSVCLDLKDPAALAWVRQLAATVDVVIHNYRTGVAERLGLGYEELAELNPGLVYCVVSGFGPTGPMAARPGIDLLFQAESGLMSITGEPGGTPVKVGTNAADVYAATTAAVCILSALLGRERAGRGCRVDVALRDAFLALQACWFTSYLATGEQPTRLGAGSPFTAPTDVYPTKDGSIVLAVVNDKHWQIFCGVLELPDLLHDARFGDSQGRVAHADELRGRVGAALERHTTQEWLGIFADARIPAGRVMDYAEVEADPQIAHNEMVVGFDHPVAGHVRMQGAPFWLDGRKPNLLVAPPTLGQDTLRVLTGLGCTQDEAHVLGRFS